MGAHGLFARGCCLSNCHGHGTLASRRDGLCGIGAYGGDFRVVLPEQSAGLLAVRTRWIDSVLLLGLGAVMVVVILTR